MHFDAYKHILKCKVKKDLLNTDFLMSEIAFRFIMRKHFFLFLL